MNITHPIERIVAEALSCGSCFHFQRCQWLLSRKGNEEECDWSPSRYAPAETFAALIGGKS